MEKQEEGIEEVREKEGNGARKERNAESEGREH